MRVSSFAEIEPEFIERARSVVVAIFRSVRSSAMA